MNSCERYVNRLEGKPVDRAPNLDVLMTQAAHPINAPLSRYYLDQHVLFEINLAALNDFHLDLVQAVSDPYREVAGFGPAVEFPEDALPIRPTPLVIEPEDINNLPYAAIRSMAHRFGLNAWLV